MNTEQLKNKLTFVTSEASHIVPGNYQKEKMRIEKDNKQRYWHHVYTFSEGNSIWRNKNYYLIVENYKESIYVGKPLEQANIFTPEVLTEMEAKPKTEGGWF